MPFPGKAVADESRKKMRTQTTGCLVPLLLINSLIFLGSPAMSQNAVSGLAAPTDILPPLGPAVPRLRFHDGAVKNNQPKISPVLPEIPGPPSPWFVAQWGQHEFLKGDAMTQNDPTTRDPELGPATFAFTAADRHSHVWIYDPKSGEAPVYELYERDGELQAGGGSNIFLSVNMPAAGTALNRKMEYSLDAKLAQAAIAYDTPTAKKTGAVLASVFSGFVIQFPSPQNQQPSTLFLQIPHASSRGISGGDYRSCNISDGHMTIIFATELARDPRLPFTSDNGPLEHLSYSVNRYICNLITHPLACTKSDGSRSSVTLANDLHNFDDWRLKGFYIGDETEAKDLRPQSTDQRSQGSVSVALQLSQLHLLSYPESAFTPQDCARP